MVFVIMLTKTGAKLVVLTADACNIAQMFAEIRANSSITVQATRVYAQIKILVFNEKLKRKLRAAAAI